MAKAAARKGKSASSRTPKLKTFDFAGLMGIERISAPAVSPDGRRVAFVVSKPDAAENKVRHQIRALDLRSREIETLTPGPGNHTAPAWSPDGKWLAFVSDRDDQHGAQLWLLPTGGGEARRVTSGWGGVGTPIFAPDSRRVLFSREVVVSADYDPKADKSTPAGEEPARAKVMGLVNEKSSARVIDDLLFRPWDRWRDRKRSHLFIVDVVTGKMNDVTPGDRDTPQVSLGTERDFAWHPNGREIAYVTNPDKVVTRSTNNSVYRLAVKGIAAAGEPVRVSNTDACDVHPRYSPDGKKLFYLGMTIPGYEADRLRMKVYDLASGQTRVYLEKFERSPMAFEFVDDDDENAVMFLAEDFGRKTVYILNLDTAQVRQLTHGTFNGLIRAIPTSDMMLVTRETACDPPDFYLFAPGWGITPITKPGPAPEGTLPDAGASVRRLTHFGDAAKSYARNSAEEFWYAGAGGDPVHGFIIKPAGFKPGKKYPLMLLIHGGPQGAFADHWHWRWNYQMFSASGAVVAFFNPRGSTGYGDKFKEQISADWGGRCYDDIMKGVDHLLATYPFIDPKRMGAAGASFGGFMINWILGHTDRFKALVCHDGVFFAETMAYTTDELWFDEYEHAGLPHVNRKAYEKYSAHRHVANFKTPTLVVHGARDYRCPESEGIGVFTALQVMGVPSRFVYFEDEGHWILKPANAQVWYHEVVGWLAKWLGLGAR